MEEPNRQPSDETEAHVVSESPVGERRPPRPRPSFGAPVAVRPSAADILLRRWPIVLIAALIVAGATSAISAVIPATYASSAKVAILVSGTDVNDTTLGANNLASQYAQMVAASPVLAAASAAVHDPAGIPSSAISGGAVAAQNLISIQATASSADAAQARASAVATAFISYISRQVTSQASSYQKTSVAQLQPLNAEIAYDEADLRAAPPASTRAGGLEATINTLIAQRAAALASIAQTAVAGRPTVTLVSDAGVGSKTAPNPPLYTLVGFIIGLLVIARLVVYFGVRRSDV